MAHIRAPKQWSLTENETITTYESWRQNLLYHLSLDKNFASYLADGEQWEKKTSANPYHGLADDDDNIPVRNRLTRVQKNTHLELLLGQIANFCPGIARNVFIKECTSLDEVWQKIRLYYGFQRTGAHFLDLASIQLENNERPEALYQRLYSFFHDNMLSPQSDITHHGVKVGYEEDMTPTLENTVTVIWLKLIHPGLPAIVKQRYGAELRNKSLATMKPEISQALPSLLDEIHSFEASKILRASGDTYSRQRINQQPKPKRQSKSCVLCKSSGRVANTHWLSECNMESSSISAIRRTQAVLLRAPDASSVIFPGEYMELDMQDKISPDGTWALEPRFDTISCRSGITWPDPQEIESVGGKVRVVNTSTEPISIPRNAHVCQVVPVIHVDCTPSTHTTQSNQSSKGGTVQGMLHSDPISVNPDNLLSNDITKRFSDINKEFDDVFDPSIKCYNGASGDIKGGVTMGPVLPPQRKGRLPYYAPEKLNDLQTKCDSLEQQGVLATPEQVGVRVEYLNLTFLVNKPNGGTRLVTDFGAVGKYSKPQPSLLPNTESVLRSIAKWKFLIKTDLSQAFYQIPLDHSSMKFCGIVTPFKGIRVYTRCAMGMPGSETALEELMSRLLGHMIQQGHIAKIADDLYVGGDTGEELLCNWTEVLHIMHKNRISLSAPKTIICPKSTVILGWLWSEGAIQALPHRIAALSKVTPPKTVKALRSYIGAYKILCRVLKGHSRYLMPLDRAVAGKQSSDAVEWTDTLSDAFRKSQQALSTCQSITLPRPDDGIWIVTDGAVRAGGVGATYYILRKEKLHLAGFFSVRLKRHQIDWLPCEVEALAIAAAVQHFTPYILQSTEPAHVLTDSRPCVLAYQKLLRGEFSHSARVSSFLSTISRFQLSVDHLAGSVNLPSDFSSRNPVSCPESSCQVCQFVADMDEAPVRSVSVQDILNSSSSMPFTSRSAWRSSQQECPDLRRTHAHLKQGTRPGKKETAIRDVKRYLQCASIASDGLLVCRGSTPFRGIVERIIVPKPIVHGLLTALHLQLQHPSAHQLKQVVIRNFFALNLDDAIVTVTSSCSQCVALKSVPPELQQQSSDPPPDTIGIRFALDVMRRNRQLIIVLRESVSAYTWSAFIERETRQDLRDAIICLTAGLRNLGNQAIHIRIDCAPGLVPLADDPVLTKQGITLDIGRVKNKNKNPVAERAIQELEREILKVAPEGGQLSCLTLALATAHLNFRVRSSGLSAREVWTQRDQMTGEQLPFVDRTLISQQQAARQQNHPHSAQSKARKRPPPLPHKYSTGDLVYLKCDGDKSHARDRYMVVSTSGKWCTIRKFVKVTISS